MPKFWECPEEGCTSKHERVSNLRAHVKKVHKYTEDMLMAFNQMIIKKKAESKRGGTFKCVDCDYICTSKASYYRHRASSHRHIPRDLKCDPATIGLDDGVRPEIKPPIPAPLFEPPSKLLPMIKPDRYAGRGKLECPICPIVCTTQCQFTEHYICDHQNLIDIIRTSFPTETEYKAWYMDKCEETNSAFTTYSSYETSYGKVTLKRCRHVGSYEAQGRLRRGHDSCKNTDVCTAFIQITHSLDGTFAVIAWFEHIGHSVDPASIPLNEREKDELERMVQLGIPDQEIIRKVRRDYDEERRVFYTTIDDIRNLREKQGLHPGQREKDDMQSVQLRVDEKAYDDGIRLFNPPLDSTGNGFALVIINPTQLEWLRRYGSRGVFFDDTHNTTRYTLHLTTMMVADHLDRGLPCGFLITRTVSAAEVILLLNEVKKLVPNFDTSWVMTDEANSFWNAFKIVWPATSAKRIICRYHTLGAWRGQAKEKLKGFSPSVIGQVMYKLREIMKTPYETAFRRGVTELFTFLDDKGGGAFVEYLRRYYMDRAGEWANFCRVGAIAQTSMYCEAWHSQIKMAMGRQKGAMRVDRVIELLLTMVEGIRINNLVNERRKLSKSSSRRQETISEHKKAVNAYEQRAYLISDDDGSSTWYVQEHRGGEQYEVAVVLDCRCDTTSNTHCPDCDACPFSMRCGCLLQHSGVACQHIHAVIMYSEGYAHQGTVCVEGSSDLRVCHDEVATTATTRPKSAVSTRDLQEGEKRKEEWTKSRSVIGQSESLLKMAALRKDDASWNAMVSFRTDMEAAVKKFQDSLGNSARNAPLAVRIEKSNMGNGGRTVADLPISIEERTKIARRQEREKKKKMQQRTERIVIADNDNEHCAICFEKDPKIPPDAHPEEECSRITSWLRCEECSLWVHFECGSGIPGRNCIACTHGKYVNNLGDEQDDEQETDGENENNSD